MNRIIILGAAAAAAVSAAPAAAQVSADQQTFTGFRVGANIGFADEDILGTEAFTYGAEVGYDYDFGGAVVGATVELQDSDETDRDISVVGRAGAKANPNLLVYGLAGYSNLEVFDGFDIDGVRLGVGAELATARNVLVKVEQRYTNYEMGAEAWQTVLGVGLRF